MKTLRSRAARARSLPNPWRSGTRKGGTFGFIVAQYQTASRPMASMGEHGRSGSGTLGPPADCGLRSPSSRWFRRPISVARPRLRTPARTRSAKLQLKRTRVFFTSRKNSPSPLGFGFRWRLSGLLHMEIVFAQERLGRREFGLNLIYHRAERALPASRRRGRAKVLRSRQPFEISTHSDHRKNSEETDHQSIDHHQRRVRRAEIRQLCPGKRRGTPENFE